MTLTDREARGMTTALKTRKPTGRPSWPIILLAGAEKSGKSYGAALATSSDLIGRSYWVTIGEDEPDEYGILGDFDIVQHDGTYAGILAAITAAGREPVAAIDGVPLLIVDSMTRLWDLITGRAQETANQRKKKQPGDDAQITMDLWNAAKDQWTRVMDAIRAFPGPVILTARLDVVAVMNDAGQPTSAKTTKVQAHKSLPYDVGAVVEMPARGETWLTGVRSAHLKLPSRLRIPDFTVDGLWRKLGLDEAETAPRDHSAPRLGEPTQTKAKPLPLPYDSVIGDEWDAQIRDATRVGDPRTDTSEADTLAGVLIRATKAGVLRRYVDDPARVAHPKTVEERIRERRDELQKLEQEARELRSRQEAAA